MENLPACACTLHFPDRTARFPTEARLRCTLAWPFPRHRARSAVRPGPRTPPAVVAIRLDTCVHQVAQPHSHATLPAPRHKSISAPKPQSRRCALAAPCLSCRFPSRPAQTTLAAKSPPAAAPESTGPHAAASPTQTASLATAIATPHLPKCPSPSTHAKPQQASPRSIKPRFPHLL